MSIKIKTERIVNGCGEVGYLILRVEALPRYKLPRLYVKRTLPVVYSEKWYDKHVLCINSRQGKETFHFFENRFYSKEDFQKYWDICKEAGEHLRNVNISLAKRRKVWHGKETFKS